MTPHDPMVVGMLAVCRLFLIRHQAAQQDHTRISLVRCHANAGLATTHAKAMAAQMMPNRARVAPTLGGNTIALSHISNDQNTAADAIITGVIGSFTHKTVSVTASATTMEQRIAPRVRLRRLDLGKCEPHQAHTNEPYQVLRPQR